MLSYDHGRSSERIKKLKRERGCFSIESDKINIRNVYDRKFYNVCFCEWHCEIINAIAGEAYRFSIWKCRRSLFVIVMEYIMKIKTCTHFLAKDQNAYNSCNFRYISF